MWWKGQAKESIRHVKDWEKITWEIFMTVSSMSLTLPLCHSDGDVLGKDFRITSLVPFTNLLVV